jgi:uncharacterized DUF497 family protein
MCFVFDKSKTRAIKREHGVSSKEAQQIFDQAYLVDQRNDDSEPVPRDRMAPWAPVCCDLRD